MATTGNKVYLNSSVTNGNYYVDTLPSSDAGNVMGEIAYTSTVGSYAANSTNQIDQTIYVEDGRKWTITGSTGNDTIVLGDAAGVVTTAGGDDVVKFGAGKDSLLATSGTVTTKYYTYGDDKIAIDGVATFGGYTFANGNVSDVGGNTVVIGAKNDVTKVTVTAGTASTNVWFANADTAVNMNASAETAAIYMKGSDQADTLIGGAGKDTIFGGDGDVVWGGTGSNTDTIDLSGAGNHVVGFAAGAGADTVTGFVAGFAEGKDIINLFSNKVSDVKFAKDAGNVVVTMGSDKLTLANVASDAGNTAQVLVKDTVGTTKVWLGETGKDQVFGVTAGNDANIYAGTAANSSTIDFTAVTDAVAVDLSHTGIIKDSRVYQNINNITGGQGDDTIIGAADAANVLAGGNGADYIWGKGAKADTLYGGDTAASDKFFFGAGDGKDVIADFDAGFADTNDKISLIGADLKAAKFGFDSKGKATIALGNDVLTLDNIATQSASIIVNDTRVSFSNNTDTTFTVGSAATAADLYVGTAANSDTINFSTYASQAFNIDLRDSSKYINIDNLTGGADNDTLIGSANSKSAIIGGEGDDSIYGGGNFADNLTGGNGADMFFFNTGDGKDVVTDYTAADGDVVKFWGTNAGVNVNRTNAGNVVLSIGTDTLTLTGTGLTATPANAATVNVEAADGTKVSALIGADGRTTNFAYDAAVNAYYGGNVADTLTVTGSDDVQVWLDGSKGTFFNSIEKIDASTADSAVILAGGANDNTTITGGTGTSSLWGGSGTGNDTLIGGTGADTFFYGTGEGNDVIKDGTAMDKVMIYSSDFALKSTEFKSGSLIITSTTGATLTIKDWSKTDLNTFQLADGSQYSYDEETKKWSTKV